MTEYLQIPGPRGVNVVVLSPDTRVTVGKDPSNTVVVEEDPTVSRLHAALEHFPAGWCLQDLGSRNGVFVNGERVLATRALRSGDEIRVGGTRITFRSDAAGDVNVTEAAAGPPELTRRERDVLVALCRPVLSADLFTEPASIRQIAEGLVVSEAAVKQHLLHLYDKFGVFVSGERRRVKLANEAVRRGAVTLADLRDDDPGPTPA